MPETDEFLELKDLWDEQHARHLNGDQLALLRYRSNLLGADLRVTNFGGGNTSWKFELPDPFSGDNTMSDSHPDSNPNVRDRNQIQARASRQSSEAPRGKRP